MVYDLPRINLVEMMRDAENILCKGGLWVLFLGNDVVANHDARHRVRAEQFSRSQVDVDLIGASHDAAFQRPIALPIGSTKCIIMTGPSIRFKREVWNAPPQILLPCGMLPDALHQVIRVFKDGCHSLTSRFTALPAASVPLPAVSYDDTWTCQAREQSCE